MPSPLLPPSPSFAIKKQIDDDCIVGTIPKSGDGDDNMASSLMPVLLATSSSDSSSMDGPYCKYTANDIFGFNSKLYLTYHVMGAGYDFLSPVGCLVGGVALPYFSRFKDLTRLQAVGTGGIIGGTVGMTCGLLLLGGMSQSKNPKIPFDDDGIDTRVNGLKYNYSVRTLDLGVWLGILGAGGALAYNQMDPTKLGLSTGTLGKLQAVGLASGAASVLTNAFIAMTK